MRTTQNGQDNGNNTFLNKPYALFSWVRVSAMRERLGTSHFSGVCAGCITGRNLSVVMQDGGRLPAPTREVEDPQPLNPVADRQRFLNANCRY
jgi:hypothetical protein